MNDREEEKMKNPTVKKALTGLAGSWGGAPHKERFLVVLVYIGIWDFQEYD